MLQLVWLMLLAVHAGALGVWWWLMPGGFPSSAPEYWYYQFAPPLLIVLMLVALVARGKLSEAILPPVLAMLPLFWMAFGISARIVFPDSFESGWTTWFIGGAILGGLWMRAFVRRVRRWWLVPLFALPALLFGWSAPDALRSPEPATTPTGAAFTAAASGGDRKLVKLTRDAQLRPDDGRLIVKRDKVIMNVQPMLSFANRSPDRTWSSLAPPGQSKATNRIFTAKAHDGARTSLYYKDEDGSVVDVGVQGSVVQLDARSRLAKPIFSHANSLVELTVQGHQKLTVAFSPAPATRVEIPPVSANARFAYVDAADTFHVVEATRRRRGPFTELATGPLKRGQPLVLTLYDRDKAVFTVTLDDWSAQASTQLSPAAGWGVPENAIELLRGADADSAPVLITATLAATSVGQGTATVGHAAGVYRDRVSVALP